MKKLRIELVWNREFNWVQWCFEDDLDKAKGIATELINSGDGARVKKVRVVDNETDKVLYNA